MLAILMADFSDSDEDECFQSMKSDLEKSFPRSNLFETTIFISGSETKGFHFDTMMEGEIVNCLATSVMASSMNCYAIMLITTAEYDSKEWNKATAVFSSFNVN